MAKRIKPPAAQPVLGSGAGQTAARPAPGTSLVPVSGTRFNRPGPALQPGQGLSVVMNNDPLGKGPVRMPKPATPAMDMGRLGQTAARPAPGMDAMTRGLTQAARPTQAPPAVAPRAVNPLNPPAGDFVRQQAGRLGRAVRQAAPGTARLGRVARSAGKAAGMLGTALEAGQVLDVATDPAKSGLDTATQTAGSVGRLSAAGAGALGGGMIAGPVGAVLGGFAGYQGADAAIRAGREALGASPDDPAASSRGVLTRAYEALRPPASPSVPPTGVQTPAANGRGPSEAGTAAPMPVMGPVERGPRGVSRVGDTVSVAAGTPAAAMLGGGGQVQSSDAAGLARVEAGLRSDVQPREGQSFVSNRFMTVPAYQTPAWLEQARVARAAESAPAWAAPTEPEMPAAPRLQTWDQRTMSFSDLGNVKRQNRLARELYQQQMAAFMNTADQQGALERERLNQMALLESRGMENDNALERTQMQLSAEAPVRAATARYYRSGARENEAQAALSRATMRNPTAYLGSRKGGGDVDKRSFQLIPNPEGGDAAPQVPVMVGQDGTAIPVRVQGGGAEGPISLAEFTTMARQRGGNLGDAELLAEYNRYMTRYLAMTNGGR